MRPRSLLRHQSGRHLAALRSPARSAGVGAGGEPSTRCDECEQVPAATSNADVLPDRPGSGGASATRGAPIRPTSVAVAKRPCIPYRGVTNMAPCSLTTLLGERRPLW